VKAIIYLSRVGEPTRPFPVDAEPAKIVALAEAGRDPSAGFYTSVLVRNNADAAVLRAAGWQASGAWEYQVDRLFAEWGESSDAARQCFSG